MERLSIEDVKRVDGYGLVIRLSDETMMRFTVEELVNMRPVREKAVNEEA